tara:strand:- start:567 stop:1256 length:690 start_codon:yes stop_codon:yes gene_type:complete
MSNDFVNKFSLDYYREIINKGKKLNYNFCTVNDYYQLGCPKENYIVIRHDVDIQPGSVQQLVDCEKNLGVPATYYVRVCGSPYNLFDYSLFKTFKEAENLGFEIGLHSNPVEFAKINNLQTIDVICSEVEMLSQFFNVKSMACHRDMNYIYNSLPFVEDNWHVIKKKTGLKCQAYDKLFFSNSVYVNEGVHFFIGWRDKKPEDVMETGKSIYLMTHNHWWYKNHPFEVR